MTDPPFGVPALRPVASVYATRIVAALGREYPNATAPVLTAEDDPGLGASPRALHPAFFGCFDWHSSVAMHWALLRLLRLVPDDLDEATARHVLDVSLSAENLQAEARYCVDRPAFERPYGWGWAFALIAEVDAWAGEDPDAHLWSQNLWPLAETLAVRLPGWLGDLAAAERVGTHRNTAFAMIRALPYARQRAADGSPEMLDAIVTAVRRWYGDDADLPVAWEPGGADFLSPGLVEAQLCVALDQGPPAARLDALLPGLAAGQPETIFTPVHCPDDADGHHAHLHGLNLSRAHAFADLAGRLGADDPRHGVLLDAARRHADASLPTVVRDDWSVAHWLPAYAVLLLGGAS